MTFGFLAGDGEDRGLHGQPAGGAGAVGEAADARGGSGRLGSGQTGPVCREPSLPQPAARSRHEGKISMEEFLHREPEPSKIFFYISLFIAL